MAAPYKLLNAESRNEKDMLRAQFYKVLFYQLKDRLCETYRPNTLDMLTRFISIQPYRLRVQYHEAKRQKMGPEWCKI